MAIEEIKIATEVAGTAMTILKNGFDVAKSIKEIADKNKSSGANLELSENSVKLLNILQSAILSQTALIEENQSLRNKLLEAQKIIQESENLLPQLDNLELLFGKSGGCGYIQKGSSPPYQSQRIFCANCFDKGIKSYFNAYKSAFNIDTLKCGSCDAIIEIANEIKQEVFLAPINKRSRLDGF